MPVRIVLADDHKILREGLRRLLDEQEDMEVVGEAGDGDEAIRLVHEIKPDLVVMDVSMPGTHGIDATRQILKEYPDIKVVALSVYSKGTYVTEMLKAGALGYVLKEQAFSELIKAVRTVLDGQLYLGAKTTSQIVDSYINAEKRISVSSKSELTKGEIEVLKLLSEGKSSKEIALMIEMSVQTVDARRRQIMQKLNLHSVAELTKYAIREGFSFLDP